jgi:transposase
MSKPHYISVGVDVSADFSFMSIVDPEGDLIGKSFKIIHSSQDSLQSAVLLIRKAEEAHSMESRTFLESTGIYHIPLFCFLVESGLDVSILNPIISHSTRNANIRKVKNDRLDSLSIARLGLKSDLKTSIIPAKLVLELRTLMRRYYMLTDDHAAYVNRLKNDLRLVFPKFIDVFSCVYGKAAVLILTKYPHPEDILNAPSSTLIQDIAKTSRHGVKFAKKKYDQLIHAVEAAKTFSMQLDSVYFSIASNLSLLAKLEEDMAQIETRIQTLVKANRYERFIQQIVIVDSIYGIGFLSAVTIMCEIGDFSSFQNPRQLFAYFGMDPGVNQSGKFNATNVHMSKRGSRFARRAIYSAALSVVRKKPCDDAPNAFLYAYYQKKCESKPKMVALGAVMHKLSNIIFAVLRDNKPFVSRSPQQHCQDYKLAQMRVSSAA